MQHYLSEEETRKVDNGHVIVSWCLNPKPEDVRVLTEREANDQGHIWADELIELAEKEGADYSMNTRDVEVIHPGGSYSAHGYNYKILPYMVKKTYIETEEE